MADHSVPDYSSTSHAVEAQEPIPVPYNDWVATVGVFTQRLGKPHLMRDGVAVHSVEEATDAIWGKGDSEVHLKRGEKDKALVPASTNIFFHCKSQEDFKKLAEAISKIYPNEVKNEITTIRECKDNLLGITKVKIITFRAFYINFEPDSTGKPKHFGKSDVLGCVGHNPPE